MQVCIKCLNKFSAKGVSEAWPRVGGASFGTEAGAEPGAGSAAGVSKVAEPKLVELLDAAVLRGGFRHTEWDGEQ